MILENRDKKRISKCPLIYFLLLMNVKVLQVYLLLTIITIGTVTIIFYNSNLFTYIVIGSLLGLFIYLFHRLYNLFNWANPSVIFVVGYFVLLIPGIIASSYYGIFLSSNLFMIVTVGLVAFMLGTMFCDAILITPGYIIGIKFLDIVKMRSRWEIFWASTFFLMGILLMLFFYKNIGGVPLLSETSEDYRVVAKAGKGYLLVASYALINVGLTGLLAQVLIQPRRLSLLIPTIMAFVIGAIFLLGSGYRSPSMFILFNGLIIYLTYVKLGRFLVVLSSILFGFIFILIIGIIGYFRIASVIPSEFNIVYRLGIWRFFVVNIYILGLLLDNFPSNHPYLMGQSYLLDLSILLPGYQPHFGFWLKEKLDMQFAGGGITQTIIGELYVNFGWIGVIIGMFILGLMLRLLYFKMANKQPIQVLRLVFLVLFSTSIMKMVSSGIILVLISDTFPLLFTFICYKFCIGFGQKLKHNLRACKTLSPLILQAKERGKSPFHPKT